MTEDSQSRTPSATTSSDAHGALAHSLGGRFELLAEIGRGSSGTVYRARLGTAYGELPAGAVVAVKFLRRELLADERARARFLAEGEIGQQIAHKNVAAIHGVETIEVLGLPVTYLVMQYVQGTTLREFVHKSGAPVEDLTRRIGADAASGLAALHRRGIVHRDVKPENLILTPHSELKIVDLGLARPFGQFGAGSGPASGSTGGSGAPSPASSSGGAPHRSSGPGLAGSVAYAAPEILRGEGATPKSDLYALGVVLFEVTTGRHPFGQWKTADEMIDAHLHRPPPRPSHLRARVSPFLEQVLLDLLQKDPDQRPKDAAELSRMLELGERSEWWRRHEQKAPALASGRRLLRMRRPAETPFCGRQPELRALDECFARAQRGAGAVVVITGPDGSGRRRLCDEAMARWLEGREVPLYLGGDADSGLGHAEPFASTLLDWLLRGDDRESPHAEARAADAARTRLHLPEADAEALARVASGRSTEAPEVRADRLASALLQLPREGRALVLRVDHAEQLDTSGRLVLHRLAHECRQRHLLLLLAAGPDGVLLDGATHLELPGLDEADFLAFGRALFRGEAVADEFLLAAWQALSGVPGNLLEALDHLAQEGQLHGRAGDYHGLAPGAELRPAPLHLARFRRRVGGLDAEQRLVLSAAAVLGERCALADLGALVQRPELAVLETLSLFRGRIVRAQGGEVSFRHRDFQKVLLGSLDPERRRDLHLQAAALLAQRGRSPLAIGMHRSQALDHEGCLDPLLDGLDERVRAGSRRTALRVAARLGVHLGQVPDTEPNRRRRLRWLLLAGRARTNAGMVDAAGRTFREAEAQALLVGDREASAAARTGLAEAELDRGRFFTAVALLESVHDDLAGLATPEADALAAQAHGLHARILLYRGEGADGQRHLQQALRRLPADRAELRCHLLIDLARLEALQHHYPTAQKTLARVEQEPLARHLPRVLLRLHLYRGQVRALLGDDEAAQDLRWALDESERLSLPTYGARAALFLGERQFWRGRDDEACETFRRACGFAVAGQDRLGEAMARCYLLRLGADDEPLAALVDDLQLPSVRANWLLARAVREPADGEALAQLAALVDAAVLPLSLHLRALWLFDRPASARTLVRTIAERIPNRAARRRFLAEWTGGARIRA